MANLNCWRCWPSQFSEPLPIGISFFVFHNISLLVDLDLTWQKAAPPALTGIFLYISFFLFFCPVRTAVAAYEQRLHAPLTHEHALR